MTVKDMMFEITLTIADPSSPRTVEGKLEATFTCDEDDYGNGYRLAVEGEISGAVYQRYYDLRYNMAFNPMRPIALLTEAFEANWTGTDGAWRIREINIKRKPIKCEDI